MLEINFRELYEKKSTAINCVIRLSVQNAGKLCFKSKLHVLGKGLVVVV